MEAGSRSSRSEIEEKERWAAAERAAAAATGLAAGPADGGARPETGEAEPAAQMLALNQAYCEWPALSDRRASDLKRSRVRHELGGRGSDRFSVTVAEAPNASHWQSRRGAAGDPEPERVQVMIQLRSNRR